MRQFWARASHPLLVLAVVVVVVATPALAGASGVGSSLVSARPLSGAPALKQAQADGIDIGAVSAPATSSNPDILAPADLIVGEADQQVALTVTLSDQSASTVSVHYATASSTAVAGNGCNNDYVTATGTLNFAPGEPTKVVRVQTLDGADVESPETFRFDLRAAAKGPNTDASAVITVVANDGPAHC